MPRNATPQSREARFKKLVLGSRQRKGKVFELPGSNQNARLQEQINKELGGK